VCAATPKNDAPAMIVPTTTNGSRTLMKKRLRIGGISTTSSSVTRECGWSLRLAGCEILVDPQIIFRHPARGEPPLEYSPDECPVQQMNLLRSARRCRVVPNNEAGDPVLDDFRYRAVG